MDAVHTEPTPDDPWALLDVFNDGQPHLVVPHQPAAALLLDRQWISGNFGRSRIPHDGLYYMTDDGHAALLRHRDLAARGLDTTQHLVVVQAGPDESPLLAITTLDDLRATITKIVHTISDADTVLADLLNSRTARDSWGAVLHYLGAESGRAALSAYDGTTPFVLDTGFDTVLNVMPLPGPGDVVSLWDGVVTLAGAEAALA